MKCPDCSNNHTISGTTEGRQLAPVKEGSILKYKRRMLGKDWKEAWLVLYDNSTLMWFKDRERREKGILGANNWLLLDEAPHLLAAGDFCLAVPDPPRLPLNARAQQLLAIGTKNTDRVHWFLAQSEYELHEWMTAISSTLPTTLAKPQTTLSFKPSFSLNELLTVSEIENALAMGLLHKNGRAGAEKMNEHYSKIKNGSSCCEQTEHGNTNNLCNILVVDEKMDDDKDSIGYVKNGKIYVKKERLEAELAAKRVSAKKRGSGVGAGIFMGLAMAKVATEWGGWGQGLGWSFAGTCGNAMTGTVDGCVSTAAACDVGGSNDVGIEHGYDSASDILASTIDFFL